MSEIAIKNDGRMVPMEPTVGSKANLSTPYHQLFQELKRALRQVYGNDLRDLLLYGSYARQEEQLESDIDVVIVLRDFEDYWQEIKKTSEIISSLSMKYDISISPVRVREKDWLHENSPFLNTVRRECVRL